MPDGTAITPAIRNLGFKTAPHGTEVVFPAIAAAAACPSLIHLTFRSVEAFKAHIGLPQLAYGVAAIVLALAVLGIPLLALYGLIRLSNTADARAPALRRILLLTIPAIRLPLLGAAGGLLLGPTGAQIINYGVFIALGAWALWVVNSPGKKGEVETSDTQSLELSPSGFARVRATHRLSAIVLLLSFLLLHYSNHLFALWSETTERSVMMGLRHWYRASIIEPAILGLFSVMVITGVILVLRHTQRPSDNFRVIQMGSGIYLMFFLASHVWAVLGQRASGGDSDWAFASGGTAGMLGSEGYTDVLLYYTLGMVFISAHVAMGIRMMRLTHQTTKSNASRTAYMIIGLGSAVTVLTVAALLGLRFAH